MSHLPRLAACALANLSVGGATGALPSTPPASATVLAAPMALRPLEFRAENLMRVTARGCDDDSGCMTFDSFLQRHETAFLLMHEGLNANVGQFRQAVSASFFAVCRERLAHSRVACGVVDIDSDRALAERFIDVKSAPAHVVFVRGTPQELDAEEAKKVVGRVGDGGDAMYDHVRRVLRRATPFPVKNVEYFSRAPRSLSSADCVAFAAHARDKREARRGAAAGHPSPLPALRSFVCVVVPEDVTERALAPVAQTLCAGPARECGLLRSPTVQRITARVTSWAGAGEAGSEVASTTEMGDFAKRASAAELESGVVKMLDKAEAAVAAANKKRQEEL